jgi:menaquinone-dependent protoporphyrinogen oxidase
MRTAVIYSTTHGTTEKVAKMISEQIGDDSVSLYNLKKRPGPDLAEFERVIIGGSIHAGRIQNAVSKFCKASMVELLQKETGLFLCGMNVPDYQKQFEDAFPELLRSHAKSTSVVGGEFLFDRMNFFQKLIVKKVSGITGSASKIDQEKIREFVNEMILDNRA